MAERATVRHATVSHGAPTPRRSWLMALSAPVLDFLNRLGRHWFMILVLLCGISLAIRGSILLDYGVAFLFREDPPLHGLALTTLLKSPSFFTELLAMLLAGSAWVFAVDLDPSSRANLTGMRIDRQLGSIGIRTLLLGLIPLLALCFPASAAVQPLTQGELARALIGWGAGFVLTLMVLSVAWLIEEGLLRLAVQHFGIKKWLEQRAPRAASWIAWNNIIWRVIILWLMYVVTWIAVINGAIRLPAVAIFALVGLLLAGYVVLNFVVERMRFYVVLLVTGLALLAHSGDPYTYTFPGLEAQYAACDQLQATVDAKIIRARAPIWCGKSKTPAPGDFRQVRRSASLRALKTLRLPRSAGGQLQQPKLVVLAMSGGGYRAAFWGALVLDRLRQESVAGHALQGFAPSIRLLTGSSGGMVPAAYFSMLPPERVAEAPGPFSLEAQIATDIGKANGALDGSPSYDSLSRIAQQLVRQDLFNTFKPWRTSADRGRALEQQWQTLDVTFEQLRAEEEAGRRPSLILSPMIAETGQPLLISNLDLTGITDAGTRQTVDLFVESPETARQLKLSTAVRMSATFPVLSPSVSLPTIPPLHVLDAGYFDDYGISIALGYLKQPDVIDWIAANTSGVILVQINAFPVRTAALDSGDPACQELARGSGNDWMSRAMAPISTPLSGLFSSRGASMVFRNDQEFDTLQQLMTRTAGKDGPLTFERVSFENAARASFSWYLPRRDLDCMRRQLEEVHNKEAFEHLAQVWNGSAPSTAAAEAIPVPRLATAP